MTQTRFETEEGSRDGSSKKHGNKGGSDEADARRRPCNVRCFYEVVQ